MNFDNIVITLQYWKLKTFLVRQLGYQKEEAIQSIKEIRRMEPNILHMFLIWFKTNQLPMDRINGVSLQEIIEQCKMDEVAAFLALNWVQVQPQAAKYAMGHLVDNLELTSNDEEELRQIAKKRGWVFPEEEPENTSDINDPIQDNHKEQQE